MPYSDEAFDAKIRGFLATNRFKDYLDIGPGAGKYGKMIKEIIPEAKVACIEAENKYIEQFDLNSIYDIVHHSKAEYFFDDKPDFTTDIVIIGDCIEHLKKSDGLDLINYLAYRCRYILIIFPSKYIQYTSNGSIFEAHLSVWNKHDFINFDYKHFVKKRYVGERFAKPLYMNLVIVRGYIGDPNATLIYVGSGKAKRKLIILIKKIINNPTLYWLQNLIRKLQIKFTS